MALPLFARRLGSRNRFTSARAGSDTLRNMAARRSLEEIEQLFDRRLGFAARSHVVLAQPSGPVSAH
jgi:hypothetical protein